MIEPAKVVINKDDWDRIWERYRTLISGAGADPIS